MDTYPDVAEHESSAKRIKLDLSESNLGELCDVGDFSSFSTSSGGPIDISEGLSPDCDSGCEASILESIPTSSHHTSPHSDLGEIPDSLASLSKILSSSPTDQADTSQGSIEAEDDNVSTISEISGLSGLSGQDWKPKSGSMIWIHKQMQNKVNPRTILNDLGVEQIPSDLKETTLWKWVVNVLSEPPLRYKLRHVNTLADVVRLIKGARNIIVLTGAGVSVSCGIPDFRSRDGIYARLAVDFPDLPDPQTMFDISYFKEDPRPFYKFARDIYPGMFKPSPCHKFIRYLERSGQLLRNYTQNIDTLEKEASIERVIECHGSFATATCTKCRHQVTAEAIRNIVLAQCIPLCEKCHPDTSSIPCSEEAVDYKQLVSSGIMKPDIVFFGEGLPSIFHETIAKDKSKCDLLLVIGSSLKVRPVALIPNSLPPDVPQILINREPLPHCHFDVELLGDCDVIINHLCHLLGGVWKKLVFDKKTLREAPSLLQSYDENFDINPSLLDLPQNIVKSDTLSTNTDTQLCSCNASTNYSSSAVADLEYNSCACSGTYNNKSMSIMSKQSLLETETVNSLDLKAIKERHMSVDSARDSGIGDNSNFTDSEPKYDDASDENPDTNEFSATNTSQNISDKENNSCFESSNNLDLKGYWQPKIKKSLADRLKPNSFFLVRPSRYIFPGAEVYYDPDEEWGFSEDSCSSDSLGLTHPNSSSSSETDEGI